MNTPTSLEETLIASQHLFHPVVHFNTAKDAITGLDFTEKNRELAGINLKNTNEFIAYINQQLKRTGSKFGIGGYNEHRTVYSISNVFDSDNSNDEPRRLHMGTDIWGKPNTPVIAPLDGIVHSFAFNNQFGDYGATIILSHSLGGYSFHTLYGHLSLNSIKNLEEGRRIEKGELFAEFGIPLENGGWPPHLHFQIIIDMGEWKGDYPGVCKFSERENWLANSPDPDLILQLQQFVN